MKCPNCNREILDSAIICPFCNTQFAFSAPSTFNPNESNVYETVQVDGLEFNPTPLINKNEDTSHEEEVNPADMTYYVDESADLAKEEFMKIDGQDLNFAGSNPVTVNPIQPEAPNNKAADPPKFIVQEVASQAQINDPNASLINNPNVQTQQNVQNVGAPPGSLQNPTDPNATVPPVQNSQGVAGAINKITASKDRMFFMSVIVIGSIVFLIIAFMLILDNNRKSVLDSTRKKTSGTTSNITIDISESKNTGHASSYIQPLYPGNTTLASIHNPISDKYIDVDVYGIRFITGVEAAQLGEAYNRKENSSFIYEGFEYRVKLNDLNNLDATGISPVLDSKVYRVLGTDFYNYNGETYFIKVQSIYDGGNIHNGEEATVKVIYSVPDFANDYSICFGNLKNTLGCFTKNSV